MPGKVRLVVVIFIYSRNTCIFSFYFPVDTVFDFTNAHQIIAVAEQHSSPELCLANKTKMYLKKKKIELNIARV